MYWEVVEGYVVIDYDGCVVDSFTNYDEAIQEAQLFNASSKEPAYVREVFLHKNGTLHGNWYDDEDEAQAEADHLNDQIAQSDYEDKMETRAMEKKWGID